MPTIEVFGSQPPFPDDLPTCKLSKVSYGRLLSGDSTESKKLFQACSTTGFFLLDLRGTVNGEDLINDAEGVLGVDRAVSALDRLEKSRYATKPPLFLFGWKGCGSTKLESGSPDRCEFYSVSQDDILGTSAPEEHPLPIERSKTLLKSFAADAHEVCTLILSHLEYHLGLAHGTLTSLHSTSKPSMTTIRLIHVPPQPPKDRQASLFGHTDNGSITILFNVIGGLQIIPPGLPNEEGSWRWVRPEPGYAIINLGDALVQWSGGVLQSTMHRVVNPPGQQAECERYSFAYVLKPESQASMRKLVSSTAMPPEEEDDQYTYNNWLAIKAVASRDGKNLVRLGGTPKRDSKP